MPSSASIRGVPRTSDTANGVPRSEPTRGAHALRVTTSGQASERDRVAVVGGIPSFALMLQAGTQSAAVIVRDHAHCVAHGVAVFAGPGNNGGDAYVVAAQLARAGVRVRLVVAAPSRTPDAQRAAAAAMRYLGRGLSVGDPTGDERLGVDGLLGTGHVGPLREPLTTSAIALAACKARGATIVALDVPSGLDATTGACASHMVAAHVTTTYGTLKRGLLLSRAAAGRIVLLDIGLGSQVALHDQAWHVASTASLAERLPAIAWDAHKGRRGHLALVGGAVGMAGAIVLAARASLVSGIGLAHAWVEGPGVTALQQNVPQAIANVWDTAAATPAPWGHALAIGPGLGRSDRSLAVLRTALDMHPGVPVVLDADALSLVAAEGGDVAHRLRVWCGDDRAVVCTPHAGEFARLTGGSVAHDWDQRATDLIDFAVRAGVTVLLKGTPTLIATSDGAPVVAMLRGSAVLATGGSGDLLTGIVGSLLAQHVSAPDAALLGATAHAVAAEHAMRLAGGIRGVTLDDVLRNLPNAWREMAHPATFPPGVLAELPAPE